MKDPKNLILEWHNDLQLKTSLKLKSQSFRNTRNYIYSTNNSKLMLRNESTLEK